MLPIIALQHLKTAQRLECSQQNVGVGTARRSTKLSRIRPDQDEPGKKAVVWRNIVEADDVDAWKLFREEWRIRLGKFLNADLGYYFGVDALKPAPAEIHVTEKMIQDLAKRSFKPTTLSIDGLESFDDENSMIGARRALKVIVDFVRQYDTADEALDGVTAITDDDREKLLWSGHRGFRAYLDTLESYSFVEGTATKRKQSAG